jgi:hypothetical protein
VGGKRADEATALYRPLGDQQWPFSLVFDAPFMTPFGIDHHRAEVVTGSSGFDLRKRRLLRDQWRRLNLARLRLIEGLRQNSRLEFLDLLRGPQLPHDF